MLDVHCHILPGVDDGSRDLRESILMLGEARRMGVTALICTPHCRDPYFDYDAMQRAFKRFRVASGGFPMRLGFEVNHSKLMDIGMGWAPRLAVQETGDFLLELSTRATDVDFGLYERTIYTLQGQGLKVTIAHPERYIAVQKDIGLAQRLSNMGCKLQVSATFMRAGRFSPMRKCVEAMAAEGLVDLVASDAHRPVDYKWLPKAEGLVARYEG